MFQRYARQSVLLAAAAAALAACATRESPPEAHQIAALTPTEQFAPEVAPTVDEILLASHGRLSPNQTAALGELVMRWREVGEGAIVVQAPKSGPGRDTGHAAAATLQGFGVPAGAIQLTAFETAPDAPPPAVSVGFGRLAAVIPQCANRWGDVTATRENLPTVNFGCAVTANIAAQVANPRDLVQARGSAPADGYRRADVLEKYRKGESTASQRSPDERGVVSQTIR